MSFSVGKRLLAVALGAMLSATVCAAPTTFITMGSGSTSGLYYPTAVGISKIINESDTNLRANARSTGASVFNANAIGKGSLQMGIMQNNIAYYAYNGTGIKAFKGNKISNLRGIITLYPESIHILARKDAGINSVADFAGKRVYVGDVGSGTEADAEHILHAYGITLDDLKTAVRGSSGSAVNLLRDGRIDAMFYTVGLGSSAITEAAQTAPIKILSISKDELKKLTDKYAFYTPFTIPAGTYPGIDKDHQTITLKATLAASADLSTEAVYNFMNVIWNKHLDEFYNDIPNPNLKKFFTVKNGLKGMSIPLHPGAVKFFKEQGVDVPSNLMPPKESL